MSIEDVTCKNCLKWDHNAPLTLTPQGVKTLAECGYDARGNKIEVRG